MPLASPAPSPAAVDGSQVTPLPALPTPSSAAVARATETAPTRPPAALAQAPPVPQSAAKPLAALAAVGIPLPPSVVPTTAGPDQPAAPLGAARPAPPLASPLGDFTPGHAVRSASSPATVAARTGAGGQIRRPVRCRGRLRCSAPTMNSSSKFVPNTANWMTPSPAMVCGKASYPPARRHRPLSRPADRHQRRRPICVRLVSGPKRTLVLNLREHKLTVEGRDVPLGTGDAAGFQGEASYLRAKRFATSCRSV